ncbi:hypothetical protein ACER0A_009660 [Haloimpatiens sp. FM7315]|uniref:hypothetical protein n=1 Tax=Haloimpatiens sp. FM7315 TaxID=3298609 RepID=UPI0035A29004
MVSIINNNLNKNNCKKTAGSSVGAIIAAFLISGYTAKEIEKFWDVSENGRSKFKIIASDITRKKKVIFPDDLIE